MSSSKLKTYKQAIGVLHTMRARREARELCEKGLISPEGTRITLGEREIRQDYSLTATELNQLDGAGLLASNEKNGEIFYFLDNDELVDEILKSQRRRKPRMIFATTAIVLLALIVVVSWYSYKSEIVQKVMRYYFDSEMIGREIATPVTVTIPAGQFLMGSAQDNREARGNEKPAHLVTIDKPFAIGKYEVTFDEYDMFVLATGGVFPSDDGWGRGERPVINVSWKEAVAYAAWLSRVTGEKYRLPSEAEWEYAARAGSSTRYWWGNDVGTGNANCNGCESRRNRKKKTVTVGSYPANKFGLHDTAGNVSEWVQDCYHDNYVGAPADGTAWESGNCMLRVLRGGSWYNSPEILRTPLRSGYLPDFKDNNGGGFRIAKDLS